MSGRKVIFADQARGAVLRAAPSAAYVIDRIKPVFNLVYCADCIDFKCCRVAYKCSNPNGLKNPIATSFCPYGRTLSEESL